MTELNPWPHGFLAKERKFVGLFLFISCLVLAHFVHEAWFLAQMDPHPVAAGTPTYILFGPLQWPHYAPETYRVAMPALGRFVMASLHWKDPSWVAAMLDFLFAFLATNLFYRLAVEDLSQVRVTQRERLLVVALFLAFLQFPIAWVVPWQRPETLPTAFFWRPRSLSSWPLNAYGSQESMP